MAYSDSSDRQLKDNRNAKNERQSRRRNMVKQTINKHIELDVPEGKDAEKKGFKQRMQAMYFARKKNNYLSVVITIAVLLAIIYAIVRFYNWYTTL